MLNQDETRKQSQVAAQTACVSRTPLPLLSPPNHQPPPLPVTRANPPPPPPPPLRAQRAGLYQYVDTVEWKVLLLWSVPPLLHGWLHGANPLLWLLLSPKCLRAAGVAAAASGADAIPVRALGARVDTLDLCVTALQWASLLVGGLALFLTPVSGRPAASYAPTSALLAVAIVLPAWQLRTLTGRVVRRVEANEDLDARWRGMKVLAQLYSLWARFRLPLCLAQAAVLIAGHAFDARNTGLQAGLLAEVVLFALVTAAGYRVGVARLAHGHLYASVMLNFYMLAITVLYLTYNRHILDDVLILVTTMGIYRSADGQAPVPEWMYSQISHPSTTILTPFIFNFCVLTLPTIVILGVHFFERLPNPQIEFFQEVLFIDLVVGLCAALLYFASFLAESLLGLAAVRRAVFINMMFAGAAASFRLWTPHQLTEDEGAAGKELSAYMLYSVLARNAFFWLVTTASFCAAMYACGTWLISSSLWVGLGARADYLNSPEPPAACKAVGRPAWRLCAAFAILMTWDMLLWVVCTTEDLCAARTGVALQVR
ncbi:hypothetical protein JKP88DRAFT_253803 [Tribonema minus]|uniref:Uncharacterized protein n=1 Tax=Tribonema minus TaxID=303371 RepID=A0A835Z7D7_9STRA|nr:hypothetical protein JKP88DRAFT_253803 [Tribonema minus]